MKVYKSELTIETQAHTELRDITGKVAEVIRASGVRDGICNVFIPHTTAGITINENADADVKRDVLTTLAALIPWDGDYRHSEGNSAAHVKAGLLGSAVSVPVWDGRLQLGTWQGILLGEFDGPRRRKAWVTVTGE